MHKTELLLLFHNIGKLKTIKRTGWVRHGISNPESVADHSFRTAFIAMLLGDVLNLDTLKLLKMSLIHDIAEAVTGDISPYCGISVEKKRIKEEKALRQLVNNLPNGNEYIDLWLEYEQQKSPEAKALRNIDKLEMAIQAKEYQQVFTETDLSEFISSARRHIHIPEIRCLIEEIKKNDKAS